MSINHHVDLVIKFIDSFTDKPLLHAYDRYYLNGLPIKPTKKMLPYVIFTNIFNNPHYSRQDDPENPQMIWQHPYYEPIILNVAPDEEQFIRAIPNENYPFPNELTAVKGIATNSTLIEIIHTCSRNQFILKSNIVANKYVEIAQSYDSELSERKFMFSEAYHDQIVTLKHDSIGIYSVPDFTFPYTEVCEIYEIVEAIPRSDGRFIIPLKNFKSTNQEGIELKMIIHTHLKQKSTLIRIKKDVINDVGKF
ncbi:hypothetical protein [Fusibacter ferrireducens]|uniref:Uncharacterized protein n=1 Tax=Fusibacter ferrireducens TaxID=2785058 RepID=A0ABR9ZNK7_9FIRM|nr:hypothetical protein [Fusibacter ferrireducens]MBF4692042.1 hypothetical protein [Fusibacter ferrireducens]